MKLISGNSNKKLAESIAKELNINVTDTKITKFNDSEIFVEINENVRGEDVFVLQSTCYPANDNLMELLLTIDALKRGSARRITSVIPYFGYARQDRKTGPRTPISAKLVANLISVAGSSRVLSLDLHSAQIQGFFDIPLDNIYSNILFVDHIKKNKDLENTVIVSPDIGGVLRARSIAKWLECDLAIVDKRRSAPGIAEAVNIIGDIKDRDCILIDDIADTAGTLCSASNILMKNGAKSVDAYITHGVFSSNALEKIENSKIRKFYCTDSIHGIVDTNKSSKIEYITIASLLAECIERIHNEESVSSLFLSR